MKVSFTIRDNTADPWDSLTDMFTPATTVKLDGRPEIVLAIIELIQKKYPEKKREGK